MAVVTSMFWTPNKTDAVPKLRENQLAFRNVAREAGWTVDVVSLVPGGGGVPGEMGLLMEFDSLDHYAEMMDREPDERIVRHNADLQASDSSPTRSSSMMEIPGTETARADLPQGLIVAAVIATMPGKQQQAIADVQKSQQIMARLGIKVRTLQAFLADPAGILVFAQYYESATAWIAGTAKLNDDAEWLSHFARAAENRQIVRMSTWAIEP